MTVLKASATAAAVALCALGAASCTTSTGSPVVPGASVTAPEASVAAAQVPGWSPDDMAFFLHGSMSTEFVPERVLLAFGRTYPDLLPGGELQTRFGLIPDPAFGWPIGVSRRPVAHLGGLMSVGINCASCHVADILGSAGATPVRVLGAPSHFDAEAFFGAVIAATFRTPHPAQMERFLGAYLAASGASADEGAQELLDREWRRQATQILAALADDPFGTKSVVPAALHPIAGADLRLDRAMLESGADLVPLVRALLRLFHNMRAALHVPDAPPETAPPASGPGRNDAFGLLSAELLGVPRPYAPVKFGIVWNLEQRSWVHWDGNARSPIGRNLLASLGLGAPLIGKRAWLDVADIRRQTDLSERIRAPRYPWAIDAAAAERGAALYRARCASCHDAPEGDARLAAPETVGTDPTRARAFTQAQADRFNALLAGLESPGYRPPETAPLRATEKYWTPGLAGVWARSPYLHNGTVRTLADLLTPPGARPATFHRGSRVYDAERLGFIDDGPYVVDTRTPGNSNAGHDYGTDLPAAAQRDLIEHLKTR